MSKYVYPQCFEIVGATGCEGKPNAFVNGEEKFKRIFIKPVIKEEDRNFEVVDEDTDTIYKVPEWLIPQIIEQIEYERMTKDWKKTYEFNCKQQDVLRVLELVLYKQGDEEASDLIRNQRLEKLQPEVYDYEYLFNYALSKIDKDVYEKEINRLKSIYNLRNEVLPIK